MMANHPPKEYPHKRAYPRRKVEAEVYFENESVNGEGILSDLSMGGAMVLVGSNHDPTFEGKLNTGDKLVFKIQCFDEEEPFTVDQVNVVRFDPERHGFAVSFKKISMNAMNTLEEIINNNSYEA
jgi:hypothetical protein